MIGLAELAANIAPVAGGLLIGVAAGYLITPDIRGSIKQDLELGLAVSGSGPPPP